MSDFHEDTQQMEHDHAYLHAHGIAHTHGHVHENQRAVINRLSRAIGHLEKVKRMVEEGHDCSEVLIQLAAVRSALDNRITCATAWWTQWPPGIPRPLTTCARPLISL